MAKDGSKPKLSDTYRNDTLRPLNGLTFILPLLVIFQAGTAIYGTALLAPRDILRILRYFGASASYLPAVLIVIVLLMQHLAHKDPWKLQPKTLAGMFGESIGWAVPLMVLFHLTGRLLTEQALQATGNSDDFLSPAQSEFVQGVLQAIGAGVYEEFIFRLMFISLGLLVLVDILRLKEQPCAIAALIVSAIVFSAYHLSWDQLSGGAQFPTKAFLFRGVAGVYLGGLYVFRGFGIAVGAHAFYNVYAFVSQM